MQYPQYGQYNLNPNGYTEYPQYGQYNSGIMQQRADELRPQILEMLQQNYQNNNLGITGTEQFQDFYYDPNQYYADFPGYANLPEQPQQKNLTGIPSGIQGLLQAASAFVSKSPIGLIGSLFGGIGSLNNRLQNSDFGRSATLAEFFQRRRDRKAREEAAARGAAKEIQRNIREGTSGDIGGGWTQRDTGGGTVSFSGPSGESFSGYSNTQEGIGAASGDWGSS